MFKRIIGSGIFGGGGLVEGSDMEFIASAEVTGSAATSIGVSGLSLSGYRRFVILLDFDNAIAANVDVVLELNSDSTASNYWRQRVFFSSTTVAGSRVNDNNIITMRANRHISAEIVLGVDTNDHAVGRIYGTRSNHTGSTLDVFDNQFTVGSKSNINSIDLVAGTSSALDVGSKMYVYGIKDS